MAAVISFPVNTMIQQYTSQQKNTAREIHSIPRREWSEKSIAGRTFFVSPDVVDVSYKARIQVIEQEVNTASKASGLYEVSIDAAKNISDSLRVLHKYMLEIDMLSGKAEDRSTQIAEAFRATIEKIEKIVADAEFDNISLINGNSEELIEPFDMLYAAGSGAFIFKTYDLTAEGLGLKSLTYDLEHINLNLKKARERAAEAINQMQVKQDSIKKITKELLDRWERLYGEEYSWIKNQSSHASQIANFLTSRISKRIFKDDTTEKDTFPLTSA